MIIVILTIVFAAYADVATGITGAFLLGVWYDVWHGNHLGITSAILLVTALLVNWYKRKFTAHTLWFLLPFSLIIVPISSMVMQNALVLPGSGYYIVWILVLTIVFYSLFGILWHFLYTPKKLSV